MVLAEIFGRDEVGEIGARLRRRIGDRHAQSVRIDATEAKHQRRRLHAALFVALLRRHAGAIGDVGVAGAVDHDLGEQRLPAALAFRDDAADAVAVHHHPGKEGVEQDIDAGFRQHLQRHGLHRFRLDQRDAHMQRTRTMLAGSVTLPAQALDELLRQPVDDLVALLTEEAEHRQPDRHVAADEAAAFDHADAQAILAGRKCCGEARGAAADYEHVILSGDGYGAGRFLDGAGSGGRHFGYLVKSGAGRVCWFRNSASGP